MRTRRRGWRIWLLRTGIAALVVAPPLLIALWLVVHHVPAWYRPARLDPIERRRAQADATEMFDWVSERMVVGLPFDIVLQDGAVNEWLAALPELWPDARTRMPRQLREFAVRFGEGRIGLGSHYDDGAWQAIVSLAVRAEVSPDRQSVFVGLDGVRAGGLPVPRGVVGRLLDPVVAAPGGSSRQPLLRSADELFSGLTIENRFVWPNGERSFRITSIVIADGVVRIGIEPAKTEPRP